MGQEKSGGVGRNWREGYGNAKNGVVAGQIFKTLGVKGDRGAFHFGGELPRFARYMALNWGESAPRNR